MNLLVHSSTLRFIPVVFFVFSHFLAKADGKPTLFDQLVEVNAQWKFHNNLAPADAIEFATDGDLIQYHLEQVVSILRSRSSVHLTEEQGKNRSHLLEVLATYAERKVFPTNLYHTIRTPYFIDNFGVHCAVGYLIQQSGNEGLALAISEEFNYNYIEDIQSPELLVWAENFGFTVDELKWIQPTYSPSQPMQPMGNGTNGTVKRLVNNNYGGNLLILGDFDTIDSQPCLNIGKFQNDQLSCFGGGIAGTVNDAYSTNAGVYVAGELESNGTTYPLAHFNGTTWQFYAIPNRSGAIGTGTFSWSSNQMLLTIQHSSLGGGEEIWSFSAPNTWELEGFANGPILDIEPSGIGRIFVGDFDQFTYYSPVTTTIPVTNVVVKDNMTDDWFGLGAGVSDIVKTVEVVGSGIYFGGTCSSGFGANNICLSRYLNGSFQSVILHESIGDPNACSINDIAYFNGTQMILGGDFNYSAMIGTFGQSLMVHDLINGSMAGLAVLDADVHSLTYFNSDLFMGGDFENQFTNQPLNHLARLDSSAGLGEPQQTLDIYPNPFQEILTIDGIEGDARYSLHDLSGKVLRDNEPLVNGQLNFSDLENGVFFLQVETSAEQFVQRIVKSDLN